jgi:hypothetical protein
VAVTVIEADADVDGLHCWPNAHEARAYLRAPHRHRFVVSARVFVGHDDRDVEWHDLRALLRIALASCAGDRSPSNGLYDFGPQSCEQMAVWVATRLQQDGMRVQRVSVSEDGEFTAHHYPDVPDPR